MDANSTSTTDACSCGAPPSEWELLEATVKKGRLWLNVVLWSSVVLGGGILGIVLSRFGPDLELYQLFGLGFGVLIILELYQLFGLGFGVLIIVKLFTKKPARSQVLKCRSCGASKVAPN